MNCWLRFNFKTFDVKTLHYAKIVDKKVINGMKALRDKLSPSLSVISKNSIILVQNSKIIQSAERTSHSESGKVKYLTNQPRKKLLHVPHGSIKLNAPANLYPKYKEHVF